MLSTDVDVVRIQRRSLPIVLCFRQVDAVRDGKRKSRGHYRGHSGHAVIFATLATVTSTES